MRHIGRICFFGFMFLALAYIVIGGILSRFASGRNKDPTFDLEDREWVASSTNPVDRALCYWVGICGGFHYLFGSSSEQIDAALPIVDFADHWTPGPDNFDSWSEEQRELGDVPQYILDHAPYVHLHSNEQYWPADVAEHLAHTSQRLNFTELDGSTRGLIDLGELNNEDKIGNGRHVYLQSVDDVESNPGWLGGHRNIPNSFRFDSADDEQGSIPSQQRSRHRELRRRRSEEPFSSATPKLDAFGRSNAPAFLIVVPKEDGVVDAFWFFFYSYNQAPKVLNIQFGNHIGDWEHTVVRFRNGVPETVSCSAHYFGSAYSYKALEKYLVNDNGEILGTWSNHTVLDEAKRPVIYSAAGSHAMYARPGLHPYILPFGVLRDETDRGPLWDPTLNLHAYTYSNETLRATTRNPRSPTGWFDFNGRWGDKYYKLSDPRQYRFAGQYHYLNGPYGPKFKKLGREHVCQGVKKCVIHDEVEGR